MFVFKLEFRIENANAWFGTGRSLGDGGAVRGQSDLPCRTQRTMEVSDGPTWSDPASPRKCAGDSRAEKPRQGKAQKTSQEKTSKPLVSDHGPNPGRLSNHMSEDREAEGVFVSLFCLRGGDWQSNTKVPPWWPHPGGQGRWSLG